MPRVENKSLKKSFALISTIFLVVLFSFFSLSILENDVFSSNLNKLKYLHIQANIHMNFVKEFVKNNNNIDIDSFMLDDERFNLNIYNEINTTIYHISISTKDETPIRLSQKVIK
ncbi:MAG: hypothetical protein U9R37_09285 [Campylobacterota bacterium]|nr:hypothetical protein [Campylobacterota bacterium]